VEGEVAEALDNGVLSLAQDGLVLLVEEGKVANEEKGLLEEFLGVVVSVVVSCSVVQSVDKEVVELLLVVEI